MTDTRTPQSDYLLDLGEKILDPYTRLPSEEAAAGLESLVREVIELVEREMPEVDVSAVKNRLGQRRPPWRHPSA